MGMDRYTGRAVSGVEQIRQRLTDVIMTPIGSRLMRRDYGSRVPELLDDPANAATALRVSAATTESILRHVPELHPTRIQLLPTDAAAGDWSLYIEGQVRGENIDLEIPITGGAA